MIPYTYSLHLTFHYIKRFEISFSLFRFHFEEGFHSADTNSYLFNQDFLDFYFQGTRVDANLCDADLFERANLTFLSNMGRSNAYFFLNNDNLSPICPYVFAWCFR